jgi:hypothetical protein
MWRIHGGASHLNNATIRLTAVIALSNHVVVLQIPIAM